MEIQRNGILIAENVEIDMETLDKAQSYRVHPLTREKALGEVLDAVTKALYPKDRERLEAYINQ
jgi:hypothetical protein